jgi:hypothetical protein
MTALDRLLPSPRLVEARHADVAAEPARAWEAVRHGDLADAPAVRALFSLRTLLERRSGGAPPALALRIDDMRSTPEAPGFQPLAETPGAEVAVGAIGKVWRLRIPFVHVADADAYARFDARGFVKVAWAIRVSPRGGGGSRVEVEVRVTATDEASWRKFRWYFAVVGPFSRFIRRALLSGLRRRLSACGGTPAWPPARGPSRTR